MTTKLACKQCGKKFQPANARHTLCTEQCRAAFHRDAMRERARVLAGTATDRPVERAKPQRPTFEVMDAEARLILAGWGDVQDRSKIPSDVLQAVAEGRMPRENPLVSRRDAWRRVA